MSETKKIALGRGVPHSDLVNNAGIKKGRESYYEDNPDGFPTYSAPKATDGDPNAFRGLGEYIVDILLKLKSNYGVDLNPENLITGSNGGFELINFAIDKLRAAGYQIGFADPTFNRGQDRLDELNDNPSLSVPEDQDGVDLNKAEDFFKANQPAALYLVPWGGNPSGSHMSDDNFVELCESAERNDGKIIADGAYMNLYFTEDARVDLKKFEKFIKNGTLMIMNTATKEGGSRGAAFLLGGGDLLKLASNTRLSPIYNVQGEHSHYYATPEYDKFLTKTIRPQLALCFQNIKTTFDKAGIELSNPDVQGGYNVAVMLPEDTTPDQSAKFFAELKTLGVNSGNLEPFFVGTAQPGFRIPFGGFSPEVNQITAHLVVAAHKKVFG